MHEDIKRKKKHEYKEMKPTHIKVHEFPNKQREWKAEGCKKNKGNVFGYKENKKVLP